MKVKLIDMHQTAEWKMPSRAHYNDAGLDCYCDEDCMLLPGHRRKIRLGFGLEIPDGYVVLLLPRSGLSARGMDVKIGTIDSGYRGEICAVIENGSTDSVMNVDAGSKICQLVIFPIQQIEPYTDDVLNQRGVNGFGSTDE